MILWLLMSAMAVSGYAGQIAQADGIPGGAIGGYVVREGTNPPEPLVNARAELSSAAGSIIARTDSSGRFIFSGLPPARYRLLVTKDGYLRQEYRGSSRLAIPPIDLRPGQILTNLAFRMNPAPTISGVVHDPSGTPIANILVTALRRAYDARGNRTLVPAVSARTDDRGNYRLYWLDPGEYFLSAEREGLQLATTVQSISASAFEREGRLEARDVRTTYAPTYFPGFAEPEDAKPIRLDPGRDAGGMDFILSERTLATVAVSIASRSGTGGGGRGQGPNADVRLIRPDGVASKARYAGTAQRGSLALSNVAPGTYLVTASSDAGRAEQRIRVSNADLTVRLTLSPGSVLNGSIYNSEGTPMDLRTARVSIAEVDPILPVPPPVSIGMENRFAIPGVQRGTYSVNVSGLPEDLYLRAAALTFADGLTKEALANPFDVDDSPGTAAGELRLLIGLDGGRIGGVVLDQNNLRFPGAQVILAPETESRLRLDLYRHAVAGEDGAFLLRGIAPGEYKLFAWDGIEPNAELNAEYLRGYEPLGTTVHITTGENPPLPLRVIEADH